MCDAAYMASFSTKFNLRKVSTEFELKLSPNLSLKSYKLTTYLSYSRDSRHSRQVSFKDALLLV